MSILHETFINGLKSIYDAEYQIIDALPKMIKAVHHEDLRDVLRAHLVETQDQIGRLEDVFGLLDELPARKKCMGMDGLLAEADELMREGNGEAAVIAAAQAIEHYEIAVYGSLIAWAKTMERDEVADILEDILNEENDADAQLTGIAEDSVNSEESVKERETTHRQ
jgi:ferritin-like metal-binding protein YciE